MPGLGHPGYQITGDIHLTVLLLKLSNAVFKTRELGNGQVVGKEGFDRGQLDRLGAGFIGELDHPIGGPGDTLGHSADRPIDGAAATRLDRGSDLGLAGPLAGLPPVHIVFACPRAGRRAVRERESELTLLARGQVL